MDIEKFIDSIYLGDRGCKMIILDGRRARIAIQIDCISRVRASDGCWHFYTDEDIVDGRIVFTDVISVSLDPVGAIPNDLIESLSAKHDPISGCTEFTFVANASSDARKRSFIHPESDCKRRLH